MTISHDRENDSPTVNTGLDQPLLGDYLVFVAARCRPNTVLAVMFDLRVFFREVNKDPCEVTTSDVFAFITAQRSARRGNVVRIVDDEHGLAASTIKRRLSSVSGLFAYLVARGVVPTNPVPHGLMLRRPGARLTPLIRVPRPLPRVLTPVEVTALLAALRTDRDRALVQLMLLGGLRRVEALGVELGDLRPGDRRVHIRHGKGGRERIVPVDHVFFAALRDYLERERPTDSTTDHVFVVLKGPNRGRVLSAAGADEILAGARSRAGLSHASCHELRHTCFTRLREAGMALEAIQAQAGHASIESTRIYLHLSPDWLARQYRQAMDIISTTWDGADALTTAKEVL
jgi:site-specific recombinase XerD